MTLAYFIVQNDPVITRHIGQWNTVTCFQTDPFYTASQLSAEEKETARNQTIPSLRQLLDLAQENDISILFDLKNEEVANDTNVTVETILKSGIDPRLVSVIAIPSSWVFLFSFFLCFCFFRLNSSILVLYFSTDPLASTHTKKRRNEECAGIQTVL